MLYKKIFLLIISLLFYCAALLMYVVTPFLIVRNSNTVLFDPNIFCCIFTMFSFFFLFGRLQLSKRMKFPYIILFFMTYITLILGNNNIFDFVVKKLIKHYENINMIESYQYEQLWSIWANDLSRNLMYLFAVFYSLLTTLIYFIFVKILRKKNKKDKNSDTMPKFF